MSINIEANITTESSNVDKNDKRCAPTNKFEFGSCIRLKVLVEMARAYNSMFPDSEIKLDDTIETLNPQKYKKYLIKNFKDKLKNKCKTQKCWSEQSFIKNMQNAYKEELEKYTWRPSGPDKGNEWLNTLNIDGVMKQYEKKYPDFKYLGTMPRDWLDHDELAHSEEHYSNLIKGGKYRFGMVYNTDKLGGRGEHWNGLFANAKTGEIYFFDSYGVQPNKDVRKHMRLLARTFEKNCDKIKADYNKTNLMGGDDEGKSCDKIKEKVNETKHQRKGSECGVYSLHFIISMLGGKTFEEHNKTRISDDEVNKYRAVFFRGDGQ